MENIKILFKHVKNDLFSSRALCLITYLGGKHVILSNYYNEQLFLLVFNIFVCNKISQEIDYAHLLFALTDVSESGQLFLGSLVSKEATCGSMFLYNPKRFMQKILERFMHKIHCC